MSSILIPVDFSLPCHNAYRFSLHLAEAFKLDVVLAHYSSGAIDPGQPFVFAGDGSLRGSHIERLQSFARSTAEGVDYPLAEPANGTTVTYESKIVFPPLPPSSTGRPRTTLPSSSWPHEAQKKHWGNG